MSKPFTKLTVVAMAAGTLALSLGAAEAQYYSGYSYQLDVYGSAMNAWSNMMLSQQQFADPYGNSYRGTPYGASNWVDNSGTLYQMDGYSAPDYSYDYTEVTPVE